VPSGDFEVKQKPTIRQLPAFAHGRQAGFWPKKAVEGAGRFASRFIARRTAWQPPRSALIFGINGFDKEGIK
jgi:hypothetical protein